MTRHKVTRRYFLMGSLAAGALSGCAAGNRRTATRVKPRTVSPNEKLNAAGIGVGGKGHGDIDQCNSENIVAVCDVDWNRAGGIFNKYPNAAKYKDFRRMLDEHPEIDAVTISTPDHMHAIAAMRCIERGKHVYVQKPLTHTVFEARQLRLAAREHGVATQMGNQGASSDMHREVCEMIWAGMIGPVREVRVWTDRPKGWWPQGIPDPLPPEPVPDHLDWDLWLGPAPERPYNRGYCPFVWRGWRDFGTGALGDIACHSLSPVKKALRLGHPTGVVCLHQKDVNEQTFPTESIIKYSFPKRPGFPELDLYWYDGGLKPELPGGIPDTLGLMEESGGILFVGDDGLIVMKGRRDRNVLIRDGRVADDVKRPDPIIPRQPDIRREDGKQDTDLMHKRDWFHSIKTGAPSSSNFEHAGPLAEFVLMGDISLFFPNQPLEWDGEAMRFTNHREANRFVTKEYREGWGLA